MESDIVLRASTNELSLTELDNTIHETVTGTSMSTLRFDSSKNNELFDINETNANATFLNSEDRKEGRICREVFSTLASLDTHVSLHPEKSHSLLSNGDDDRIQENSSSEIKKIVHTGDKDHPFKCGICSKTFRRLYRAKSHARTHSGHKPFICSICHQHFTCSDNLNTHLKTMHNEESSLCEVQEPKIEIVESDVEEMIDFKGNTIVIEIKDTSGSTYTFPVQQNGADELFCHSSRRNDTSYINDNTYCFDLRTSEIISAKEMKQQMARDRALHRYPLLGLRHQQVNSYENRKVMYTGDKDHPFKCRVCSKTFRRLYRAKNHARSHSGQKPFLCPHCSKVFGSSDNLYRHVKKMHKRSASMTKTQTPETQGAFQVNEGFTKDIPAHQVDNKAPPLSDILRQDVVTNVKKEDSHSPSYFINLQTSKSDLTQQMQIVKQNSQLQCLKMEPPDDSKGNVVKHESGSNTTSTATATQSPKEMAQPSILSGKSNSPCTCHICGKEFKRESYLKRHMICHSDDKPFKCSLCPKAFNRQYRLNNHWRTHTGEKPYVCSVCSKTFAVSDNMYKHIRKMHQGKGIESASGLVKQVQEKNREKKYAHMFGYEINDELEDEDD